MVPTLIVPISHSIKTPDRAARFIQSVPPFIKVILPSINSIPPSIKPIVPSRSIKPISPSLQQLSPSLKPFVTSFEKPFISASSTYVPNDAVDVIALFA